MKILWATCDMSEDIMVDVEKKVLYIYLVCYSYLIFLKDGFAGCKRTFKVTAISEKLQGAKVVSTSQHDGPQLESLLGLGASV